MTKFCRLFPILFLSLCDCSTNEGTLFNVTASLTSTTCGSGAANADDSRSFQIRLTKDDTTLTWYDTDTGNSTVGTLSSSTSDGTFTVAAGETITVTEASGTNTTGCSVRRHDKYSGDDTLDSKDAIKKLDGTLEYDYSEATGYDCDALLGTSDGFTDLPCVIKYSFVATPD